MWADDRLEQEVKDLKKKLSDRDGRLTTLERRVLDQEAQLQNAKQAASTDRERGNEMEERATKAEEALKAAKEEVSRARINSTNFEARVRAEADKAAELAKEKRRLEYELESLNSFGASANSHESELRAKVKSLEQELKKKELDLDVARAQITARSGNSNSTGSPGQRGRRRASSVNGGELATLTTERDAAAGAVRDMSSKAEALERKLAAATKERDQAVNSQMALEKRSGREIQQLKDEVADLQHLLNSNDNGDAARLTEKLRADLKTALGRAETLESSLHVKEKEIEDLRAEVAADNSAKLQEELTVAQEKVESLGRERDTLKADLEAVQESTAGLKATIAEYSPDRVKKLEAEIDQLKSTAEREQSNAKEKVSELEVTVATASKNLEEAKANLKLERAALVSLRSGLEIAVAKVAKLDELEKTATDSEGRAAELQSRVSQLQAELEESSAKLIEAEQALQTAQGEQTALAADRDALQAASVELAASKEMVATLQNAMVEMETQLSQEIETLRSDRDEKEKLLSNMTSDLTRAVKNRNAATAQLESLERELANRSLPTPPPENNAENIAQLAEYETRLSQQKDEIDRLHAELQDKIMTLQERDTVDREVQEMRIRLMRLEQERNDAKGELSFVHAEHRFLGEEADEEHAALTEHLAEAQAMLGEKLAAHDALQAKFEALEVEATAAAELKDQCESLSTRMAAVEQERDTAMAQVSELKSRVSELEAQVATVGEKLATAEGSFAQQLAQEQDLRRKAENRAEELTLTAKLDSDDTEASAEIKSLFERIERRDVRISNLDNDLRKLQANYDLAKESIDDLSEELEAAQAATKHAEDRHETACEHSSSLQLQLQGERDRLRSAEARITDLTDRVAELAGLTAAHQTLQADHAEITAKCSALQETVDAEKAAAKHRVAQQQLLVTSLEAQAIEAQRQFVLALAIQRQALQAASKRVAESEVAVEAANARIASLQEDQSALLNQGSQTLAIRAELDAAREAVAAAEVKAASSEALSADLAVAHEQRDHLEAHVHRLESDLAEVKSAHDDVTAKVALLEQEIVAANSALAESRNEHDAAVADLSARLLAANTANDAQQTFSAEAQATIKAEHENTIAALQEDHSGAISALDEQLATARNELEQAQTQLSAGAEEKAAFEQQLGAANEQLTAAHNDLIAAEAAKDALQGQLAAAQEQFEAVTVQKAQLEEQLSTVQQQLASASEALATVHESHDALQTAQAALEEDLAQRQNRIAELEEGAVVSAGEVQQLSAQLDGFREENDAANCKMADLTSALDESRETIDVLSEKHSQLASQLDKANAALAREQELVLKAQSSLDAVDKEHKQVASKLRFAEKQRDELLSRISALRAELQAAQDGAKGNQDAEEELQRLKMQLAELRKVKADLEEDVERAEASLTSKTYEVEEADDRAMELNKNLSKLKRKNDKLERQVKSLGNEVETLRNTAVNSSPPRAKPAPSIASSMRPPPLPVIAVHREAPSPVEPRIKPKAVNVFAAPENASVPSPAARATGTPSTKRRRDEEDRPVPREVRVQPSALASSKSPAVRRSPLSLRAAAGVNAASKLVLGADKLSSDTAVDEKRPLAPRPVHELSVVKGLMAQKMAARNVFARE